ncbi:MAG: HAD family hydrolase, partial [Marinobacter sp.]|uniref:HAD family hydrolase n=1 Tax=Marinobacter sp. TaxID=50741 RepID=UPI00299DBB92
KTEAFYQAALPYGESAARALVEYHVNNGGISRYAKFERFLTTILGQATPNPSELEALLARYARLVKEGLAGCEVAEGLTELRELMADSTWLVVSGGDQAELRTLFRDRGLDGLFDGGIFGSPDTKDEILARELDSGRIRQPAVFLGDSQYDFEAAQRAGLDFFFLSAWSESAYHFNGADRKLAAIRDLVSEGREPAS